MGESTLRRMPERVDLGQMRSTVIASPINQYEHWLRNPANENPHGLRTVMGYCLPAWQRRLVWSAEQKTSFLESAWKGIPLGSYAVNQSPTFGSPLDNLLIDGQQRMSALEDYLQDEFPVFGWLWSEVTAVDRRFFEMSTAFPSFLTTTDDEAYLRDYYNLLNFGGVRHKETERA